MAKGTVQVAVPLAGGLDTKTDAKVVLPNKMLAMENRDFTKGGSVKDRFGYRNVPARDVTGALITDALAVAPLNDGWVLLSRTKAYMLDRVKNAWSNLGAYCPMTHEEREVAYSSAKQSNSDMDTTNGVTAVAWEDSRGGIRCTVMDEASGAAFVAEYTLASANASKPRVVAVGANLLITWFDSAGTAIKCRVVKTTDVSGTIGSSNVTLTSDANAAAQYDMCGGDGVAYLAFRQDAAVNDYVRLFIVNSIGAATFATEIAEAPDAGPVLAWGPDDSSVYVAYTNATNLKAAKFSGSDLALIASTTVLPFAGDRPLAISPRANGGAALWFQNVAGGSSTGSVDIYVTSGSAFSWTAMYTIGHAELASTGFYDGLHGFCVLRYNDSNLTNTQNTFYVYREDAVVVGRILPGEADGTTAWLPRVKPVGDDKFVTALGFKRQVQVNLDKISGATLKQTPVFEHQGVQRCDLDASPQVYATEVDGVLYTSGGFLWAIDGGGAPVEAQFLQFPDLVAASFTTQAGGSKTATATYTYRVYYEWVNARGQRVRSLSLTFTAATTANQTVRIALQTLGHTRMQSRSPVSIVVYCSEANQATVCYRVSSEDPTATGTNGYVANTTANTINFDDALVDTTTRQREWDYISYGETEHFAFDAPTVVAPVGNRVFTGGGGRSPNRPQFSLTRQDGRPVETNDTWVVTEFPEHGGRLVGFSDVNGVPVVFKERAIYFVRGSGPTNQRGAVSDYQAQAISSDVGLKDPLSLVRIPDGVMFKSAKGIYQLGESGDLQYIGAEVERYNNQTITGAAVIPDTNQVVFLTDSGMTLMYDYYYKQWGTYTNHEGMSCAVTESEFAYLRNDGELYIRDTSTYLDAGIPYDSYFRTAPLHIEDSVQGFEKLLGFQCVGEYISPHITEVELFYNRERNPYQTITIDPTQFLDLTPWGEDVPWGDITSVWGGSLDGQDYAFEAKPKRTKFSTISFGFRGRAGSPSGAKFEMTELLLDVKKRGGAARLPSDRKI